MALSDKMFRGMAWSAIERISIQVVSFALGIVLARILTPTEYGIIGLLTVFISISTVFVDSGFAKALIQKQDRSENDISTTFLFNLGISIVCYIVLWFTAPFVSDFYGIELLTQLLRVLAISLIINALFNVPATLIIIDLNFKVLTKIKLAATIFSGVIAIYMAYTGYGVWALVAQVIIRAAITGVLMWLVTFWRPKLKFSKSSFNTLFSFGSKLLISSLLGVLVSNFQNLFIAKMMSARDLGFYTRGGQFSDMISNSIGSVLDSVLLPTLSTVQNQRDLLIKHTKNVIISTSLLVVPVFLGLAILAEPVIRVLLTEKWMPAVPVMQILCMARMITNISGINVNLLYVLGRTDLALKQQYIKLSVRILLIISALQFGIIYIALAELISTIIHYFINTYYPGKIMSYGALSQIKSMARVYLAGIIMLLVLYFELTLIENDIMKLIVGPITGAIVYSILIYLLKIPEAAQIVVKFKNLRKK